MGFFDSANVLPSSSSSFGLGSNESTCETPPSMNRKMTFFAFGGKCRGDSSDRPAMKGSRLRSSDINADRASSPNPFPALASISRRVTGRGPQPGQPLRTLVGRSMMCMLIHSHLLCIKINRWMTLHHVLVIRDEMTVANAFVQLTARPARHGACKSMDNRDSSAKNSLSMPGFLDNLHSDARKSAAIKKLTE